MPCDLAFLAQWRVESSKDLSDDELKELRSRLHDITDTRHTQTGRLEDSAKADEIVAWRKRVYGVVGAWLRDCGYRDDAKAIRTVVCRAAGRDSFNHVSLSEFKQIYASWRSKQAVAANAAKLIQLMSPAKLN